MKTMNFSRSSSCMKLLLVVVFVIVQCTALPVHLDSRQTHSVRKRTATTSSNSNSQVCTHASGSCHFYSHCIDSLFHCGSSGFAQAFAKVRCEATNSFIHSQDSCDKCISNSQLYEWVNAQEACFEQRLKALVDNEFTRLHSDPPNCLQLERRGLAVMQDCFNQESTSFCSALNQNSTSAEQDIQKIAAKFRVSEYYTPQVERSLGKLVRSCGDEQLADSLLTSGAHSPRIVFCALIDPESQSYINPDEAAELVALRLNRPSGEFEFSGIDNNRQCATDYPDHQFTIFPVTELLYITWRPSPDDPLIHNLNDNGYFQDQESELGVIGFYEYPALRWRENFPECGDGRRQAGELCDTGVSLGIDTTGEGATGCAYDCTPMPYTECSTGQLELSSCWTVQCGDGVRSASEDCDDGNRNSGDGCSMTCTVESDFECIGSYNTTSECSPSTDSTTDPYPPATTTPPPSTTGTTSPPAPPPSTSSPTLTSSTNTGRTQTSSSANSIMSPTPPLGISASAHLHSRSHVVLLQCSVSILLTCLTVSLLSAR